MTRMINNNTPVQWFASVFAINACLCVLLQACNESL
uniref:Uncharacterized protein n=1 Tax=Glossina brevipalpis TaxID=37001 RepID=A0A1A9WVL5_9MUSC